MFGKKIFMLFVILIGCFTTKAQIGITDVALNKKLVTQLKNNGVSLAYEKIKKAVADGLLAEAGFLAKEVDDKYKLMDNVFKTNSELKGMKKIKNSYYKAYQVNRTIIYINEYVEKAKPNTIPSYMKVSIKKATTRALDDMKLANETIEYALNDENKLSLKDRVDQFDEADRKIEGAALKLEESVVFIKGAILRKEQTEKRNYYFNLKYNGQ